MNEPGKRPCQEDALAEVVRDIPAPGWPLRKNLFTFAVLGGIVFLGLSGVAGGAGPVIVRDRTADASLAVTSLAVARSGIRAEYVIEAEGRGAITKPIVEIPYDWLRDITVNTIRPEPKEQARGEGDALQLIYDPMAAGERLTIQIDLEVNHDRWGTGGGRLRLLDDERELAAVSVKTRVLP